MKTRMEILRRMAVIIIACICSLQPTQAQNTSDIVDRLNASLGVQLPSQYQTTVKNFVKYSKILSDKDAQTFTEQFIKDQMKTDWGINKQNQLLFIWDAVYGQIIKDKQLYTGEDGNQARLDEFEKVMEKSEDCGKKYNDSFKAYMRQRSAEADRRSAEADQSRVIYVYAGLCQVISYYSLWNVAPESAKIESELKETKEYFKYVIKECKEFNIDYQSLLPTEVQRFYDLNPVQENAISCDKAEANILNIVLQEIVKLYNIYQRAPQAKREIHDIKNIIEDCKKYNIDYKKVLTPEMLKFFGVE